MDKKEPQVRMNKVQTLRWRIKNQNDRVQSFDSVSLALHSVIVYIYEVRYFGNLRFRRNLTLLMFPRWIKYAKGRYRDRPTLATDFTIIFYIYESKKIRNVTKEKSPPRHFARPSFYNRNKEVVMSRWQ